MTALLAGAALLVSSGLALAGNDDGGGRAFFQTAAPGSAQGMPEVDAGPSDLAAAPVARAARPAARTAAMPRARFAAVRHAPARAAVARREPARRTVVARHGAPERGVLHALHLPAGARSGSS